MTAKLHAGFRVPLVIMVAILSCFMLVNPGLAKASEPIKIGTIMAKTGEAAPVHLELAQATRLAVDMINQQGGLLGRQVQLIEYDNRGTAIDSRRVAMQAVKDDVVAVLGAIRSSSSLSVAPVLQEAGIPMITPTSTNPAVTRVGDYIFRVCFLDSFQGKVMADFAFRELKAADAVVLTNTGNKYSTGLAKAFIEHFNGLGGSVLWEGDYLDGVSDYPALMEKVRSLNPEVIFVPGYTADSSNVIKIARKTGISSIFLGGDGWSDLMYFHAGPALDGSFQTTHWHPSLPGEANRLFLEAFTKKYGSPKIRTVALAFDGVNILAQAISSAQSLDGKKIRDAIASTSDFSGITGAISFDKNGDPIKSAVIVKLEKGDSSFVKSVSP